MSTSYSFREYPAAPRVSKIAAIEEVKYETASASSSGEKRDSYSGYPISDYRCKYCRRQNTYRYTVAENGWLCEPCLKMTPAERLENKRPMCEGASCDRGHHFLNISYIKSRAGYYCEVCHDIVKKMVFSHAEEKNEKEEKTTTDEKIEKTRESGGSLLIGKDKFCLHHDIAMEYGYYENTYTKSRHWGWKCHQCEGTLNPPIVWDYPRYANTGHETGKSESHRTDAPAEKAAVLIEESPQSTNIVVNQTSSQTAKSTSSLSSTSSPSSKPPRCANCKKAMEYRQDETRPCWHCSTCNIRAYLSYPLVPASSPYISSSLVEGDNEDDDDTASIMLPSRVRAQNNDIRKSYKLSNASIVPTTSIRCYNRDYFAVGNVIRILEMSAPWVDGMWDAVIHAIDSQNDWYVIPLVPETEGRQSGHPITLETPQWSKMYHWVSYPSSSDLLNGLKLSPDDYVSLISTKHVKTTSCHSFYH